MEVLDSRVLRKGKEKKSMLKSVLNLASPMPLKNNNKKNLASPICWAHQNSSIVH